MQTNTSSASFGTMRWNDAQLFSPSTFGGYIIKLKAIYIYILHHYNINVEYILEPVRTQSIPSSAFPFYLRSSDFHIPSDSCPRPYPNGIMMSHKLLPLFVSTLFLVFIEQSLWFPVTLDTAEPCDGWIFPSITGSGYGPSVTLLAQGSL